jgi:hypothetical protein
MKKLLIALSVSLVSCATQAQQPSWSVVNVSDSDNVNVGYIYQSYAQGTQYSTPPEKHPTALRLICSTADNSPAILGIYWDKASESNANLQLKISVDRQLFQQDWYWMQDGSLIYRSLSQSDKLIEKMKSGRLLTVEWNDTNMVRHVTIFGIADFKTHLSEFTSACNKQ